MNRAAPIPVQTPRRRVERAGPGIRLLHEHAILILTLMLCIGAATIMWHLTRLSSSLIESAARSRARRSIRRRWPSRSWAIG